MFQETTRMGKHTTFCLHANVHGLQLSIHPLNRVCILHKMDQTQALKTTPSVHQTPSFVFESNLRNCQSESGKSTECNTQSNSFI